MVVMVPHGARAVVVVLWLCRVTCRGSAWRGVALGCGAGWEERLDFLASLACSVGGTCCTYGRKYP